MKVKLTEICTPKQWKTIPANELLDEGYPVYGANGIIGCYNEYNHENSVVTITCRGATCGTVNITEPKAYITGNAMCLDNVRPDILLEYLYYSLLYYDFRNVISGSAQPQITRQGLEKVKIAICSIEEQNKRTSALRKISTYSPRRCDGNPLLRTWNKIIKNAIKRSRANKIRFWVTNSGFFIIFAKMELVCQFRPL